MRAALPPIIAALVAFAALASQAHAGAEDAARNFVARANAALTAPGADAATVCADMSDAAFDADAMVRAASDGATERMSADQRARYRKALLRRVAGECRARVAPYVGAGLTLAGVRETAGEIMIATQLASGAAAPILWRGRTTGGAVHITDILVNGRSAVQSARDEARAVLERNADDVEALVRFLER
jgi:ABC-type transporter MlaC component